MSSPIRVLFVLPSMGRTGAVDFIVDLAGAMASRECTVEILVLNGAERDTRRPKELVTVTTALRDESPYLRRAVPARRFRRAIRLPFLLNNLVRSVLRSDVVILTWEMGSALVLPGRVAYILRKPTVAIVQNNVQRSIADYGDATGQMVLRHVYARARAVVCVTDDLLVVVEEVGVRKSKLVAIPNAVDIERVRVLAKHRSPSALAPDDVPTVVGVGRLAPQKGFDLLIRAHAELMMRGVCHRLILIGNGPDKSDLMALAAEQGVGDSVLFPGYLANPYPAMVRSSVCCFPSRYEGRPLALAEAALLGVPMIAANCPTGPREILADGLYGELVETESVDALSAAIEKHLRDPQRLILKAKASEKESNRFSIQTCAQKYVALIHQILE